MSTNFLLFLENRNPFLKRRKINFITVPLMVLVHISIPLLGSITFRSILALS